VLPAASAGLPASGYMSERSAIVSQRREERVGHTDFIAVDAVGQAAADADQVVGAGGGEEAADVTESPITLVGRDDGVIEQVLAGGVGDSADGPALLTGGRGIPPELLAAPPGPPVAELPETVLS